MAEAGQWRRPQPIATSFTEEFWAATKEKKLVLQFCPESQKFQHYPRPLSIYCGRRNIEWRQASGRGVVYAYTVTRRGPPEFHGREPYIVASVELDEGVRILSNIINCSVEDIRVLMPVQLCWEPIENGLHYPLFEPAKR
jgi:uncharacterized OB-fold protein